MMIEQRPHLLRIFLLEMRRLPDNRTTFLTNAADNETSAAHPAPPPYRKVDRQTMLTGQETTPTCRNFMQFFLFTMVCAVAKQQLHKQRKNEINYSRTAERQIQ